MEKQLNHGGIAMVKIIKKIKSMVHKKKPKSDFEKDFYFPDKSNMEIIELFKRSCKNKI